MRPLLHCLHIWPSMLPTSQTSRSHTHFAEKVEKTEPAAAFRGGVPGPDTFAGLGSMPMASASHVSWMQSSMLPQQPAE